MMQLDDIATLDLRPPPLRRPAPRHVRIGMIGLGRVVQNNILPAYTSAGLSVVAACDPDPTALERTRDRFGITQLYSNYREMLESAELDVVDINLRWDRGMSAVRVDAVAAAAERGLHVLIAKPLAEGYDQCEAIVAAARAAGVTLAVNQNSRYGPAFYGARRLIEAGVLGPLVSGTICWNAARGIQHSPEFDVLHDVTVHSVDVMLAWFDQEPELVFADQTRRTPRGSVVTATLTFPGGMNGSIRDDFVSEHHRGWDFSLAGELGSVDGLEDIEIPEAGQPRMLRGTLRIGLHALGAVATELPLVYRYAPESFLATMLDLLHAIEAGTQPWASGENVLRTMRTLWAIERSDTERTLIRPAELKSTTRVTA
jgi:predicted dehydrogenase